MTLPFSQQVTADATCRLLQAGSNLAASIAVASVFTGQVWGAVGGTAGAVAMEALGRASGCYNNPNDAPGFEPNDPLLDGCQEFSSGSGNLFLNASNDRYMIDQNVSKVGEPYIAFYEPLGEEALIIDYYVSGNPSPKQHQQPWRSGGLSYSLVPKDGAVCGVPAPTDPKYPDWQPDTPIGPAYDYTDPETGCNWSIVPMDVYLNSAGEPTFHWKAVSDDPANCGDPYEWWGNGQEPNIPNFPDPGGPNGRPHPPSLPPGPGQDIKDDLDKIKEELEKLKECACPEKPVQMGDYRTISFRSDETSPFGKSRLRKRFKYRSQSGLDLGAVVNHWASFEFAAGSVIVFHTGSSLGSPKVWAATVDEGKRVIRHAGGEAGIDPDQVGEWGVSGSDNSRYGVSGQMRVDTTGGYYWITARDGEDGRPIVAKT